MMLATLHADNSDSSGWARGLLQFIYGDVENMYLLALTAEFVASARKTVKGFEERKAYGLSIVLTVLKIRALKDELDMLFKTRDSGSARIPFAMSPEYTNGFVQLMERAAVLTESTALVSEHCGRLLCFALLVSLLIYRNTKPEPWAQWAMCTDFSYIASLLNLTTLWGWHSSPLSYKHGAMRWSIGQS